MKFRKYFKSLFIKSSLEKTETHHKRKVGIFWGRFIRILSVKLIALTALIFFLLYFGTAFAQAPVKALIAQITKPKPIVQSSTTLPANVQSAIENLAGQEIKAENANANLAVTLPETNSSTTSVIQPLIDSVQEVLTSDPESKAKIKLRIIDREITELQNLLEKDKSDKAADQAVRLIADIGQKTGGVVTDPKVQTNREIIKLQIEQYNRLQLILQKLEDNLPIESYFKIEDARVKYLVSGAIVSLNAAPNLNAVHNIALLEVGRLVGDDFAELKAIEVLTDIESGLNQDAKVKLAGLQKELAIQFEKRVLKLPPDVRTRKLQNYLNYSFGNPVRQVQAFEQMENFLTDRELILNLEGVKELALGKLRNRVFEIDTNDTRKQFWDEVFKNPKDIRVMTLLQMYIQSGTSEADKKEFAEHETIARTRIAALFGQNPQALEAITGNNILDLSIVSQIDQILENSPEVPSEVKLKAKQVLGKTLGAFLNSVSQKNFVSAPKIAYNPVTDDSDVRLLSPNPQTIILLRSLRNTLPVPDQQKIDIALRAQVSLLQEHLLANINDPAIFGEYEQFITNNPQVKQILQSYLGQSFFTNLAQKKKLIDKQIKEDEQALFEKMQQIVQEIFIAPDAKLTDAEKQLPTEVIAEINKLKQELPDNNVPKLDTPEGVTLREIAKLPDDVNAAIIAAAKQKIAEEQQSKDLKLDLTLEAKDLGISEPAILPGNPLYGIEEILQKIELVITLDPVARAEKVIDQANEKTLEAAILLEQSQSQETIDLALNTLAGVQADFDLLKQHAEEIDTLKQENPEAVDKLVDQVIENGIARQTVFSSIEDKVYGDDFVKVEEIRQEVLKDGIETLLNLTDNNTQSLVDKLEQAVETSAGSEFKEIKAVELLIEIEQTQPKDVQVILDQGQEQLAQTLEDKLLQMPVKERTEKLLDYADSLPGNPVNQFETYEVLKDNFEDPQLILLTESLKDKAVENLTDIISEITDAASQQQFTDTVIGDRPEDLKIITEIELRVQTPQTVGEEPTPIEQKIEDIKAEVEQNIIDTYKDNPEALAQTELFSDPVHTQTPDIIDIQVVKELTEVLERTPEIQQAVIEETKKLEETIIDQFIENVSSPTFTSTSNEAAQALEPVPQIIQELVDLKEELPPAADAKIDIAIAVQVDIIEKYLSTQVDDPVMFQTYIAQIEENPEVLAVVTSVGGTDFVQAVEEKAQEIATTATTDQTLLETTVAAIEQEIFTSPINSPSSVEQTLSSPIQEEIQQIKQEVPVEQIPQVTVEAQVIVTTPDSTTSEPAPTSAPVSVPAPEAPAIQAPVVENKPAEQPAAPAAPAVPGI